MLAFSPVFTVQEDQTVHAHAPFSPSQGISNPPIPPYPTYVSNYFCPDACDALNRTIYNADLGNQALNHEVAINLLHSALKLKDHPNFYQHCAVLFQQDPSFLSEVPQDPSLLAEMLQASIDFLRTTSEIPPSSTAIQSELFAPPERSHPDHLSTKGKQSIDLSNHCYPLCNGDTTGVSWLNHILLHIPGMKDPWHCNCGKRYSTKRLRDKHLQRGINTTCGYPNGDCYLPFFPDMERCSSAPTSPICPSTPTSSETPSFDQTSSGTAAANLLVESNRDAPPSLSEPIAQFQDLPEARLEYFHPFTDPQEPIETEAFYAQLFGHDEESLADHGSEILDTFERMYKAIVLDFEEQS